MKENTKTYVYRMDPPPWGEDEVSFYANSAEEAKQQLDEFIKNVFNGNPVIKFEPLFTEEEGK